MGLFRSREKAHNNLNEPNEFIIDDNFKVIFNSRGLAPVIIQDEQTSEILKLGYLDRWALEMSFKDKKVYLYRRSLQRLEVLGEDQNVEYKITAIKLSRNHRNLLFKVLSSDTQQKQTSFTHTIYPQK
jgi:phosphoribosyl-AMP cyclohydrolase